MNIPQCQPSNDEMPAMKCFQITCKVNCKPYDSFQEAKSLRVLDVGHNRLLNVSVTGLMASQLNLLDMACNPVKVDRKEFKSIK